MSGLSVARSSTQAVKFRRSVGRHVKRLDEMSKIRSWSRPSSVNKKWDLELVKLMHQKNFMVSEI